jgi:signal transduction histidine kinase/ligand-binding sensor domain-containing protein
MRMASFRIGNFGMCGAARIIAVLLVSCFCTLAVAGTPAARPWTLDHYHHRSWTAQEGAPSNVTDIAQTSDGYLWFASSGGLYRFDGEQFELFKPRGKTQLLDTQVYKLYAPKKGGLWVGYVLGGASFIQQGVVRNYTVKEGFYSGTSGGFAEDSHGRLWAAVTEPVAFRLDGDRWKMVREGELGIDGKHQIYAVLVDDFGTLWLSAKDVLYYMQRDATRFSTLPIPAGAVQALAQGQDHSLWLQYDNASIGRLLYGDGKPVVSDRNYGSDADLPFCSGHGLWFAVSGHGIGHVASPRDWLNAAIPDPALVEHFDKADGLSSDVVNHFFEDAEGDVWVGTSAGVDRFSPVNFVLAPRTQGLPHAALIPGMDGSMWAASTGRATLLLDGILPGGVDIPKLTMSGFHDAEGNTWFGSLDGIRKLDTQGHLTKVADSPRPGEGVAMAALTRQPDGSLLAAMAALNGPAYRYANGKWSKFGKRPAPFSLLADEDGAVWQAYQSGEVERTHGGESRVFTPALGALSVVMRARGRVWVAGQKGVAWMADDAFHPLAFTGSLAPTGVSGLVSAADGSLWLHATQGVVRVAASELDAAFAHPEHAVSYRLFDSSDGLPGPPTAIPPIYSAAAGTDGRLWFSTAGGVTWIDPNAMFVNQRVPPVQVQTISADGKAYLPGTPVTLPAHTGNLSFRFAALSYVAPERVHFRYRLSGVDQVWRETDSSRETTYTNLDPGTYTFQVTASNNDGLWNKTGATQVITVLPGPMQTWGFRLLCALVVAAALIALHFWRLKRVEKWARLQTTATLLERERIARDLHDTLLQGVQGLQLRLQTWAASPRLEPAHRQEMADVAIRARDMLIDGRDRIIALRRVDASPDLAGDLRAIALDYTTLHHVGFTLTEEGTPRPLITDAAQQIVDIAREGLRNAFVHAAASEIELSIDWQPGGLRVCVRDNGRGIEETVLRKGGRAGHWGLLGMRERAVKIGARLELQRCDEGGTQLQLMVPARVAYAGMQSRLWHWMRRTRREALV